MGIYIIHMNLFPMRSATVVSKFDEHILNCLNSSMVLAEDCVDHFHSDIFYIYLRYFVMFGYCLNQICKTKKKKTKIIIYRLLLDKL